MVKTRQSLIGEKSPRNSSNPRNDPPPVISPNMTTTPTNKAKTLPTQQHLHQKTILQKNPTPLKALPPKASTWKKTISTLNHDDSSHTSIEAVDRKLAATKDFSSDDEEHEFVDFLPTPPKPPSIFRDSSDDSKSESSNRPGDIENQSAHSTKTHLSKLSRTWAPKASLNSAPHCENSSIATRLNQTDPEYAPLPHSTAAADDLTHLSDFTHVNDLPDESSASPSVAIQHTYFLVKLSLGLIQGPSYPLILHKLCQLTEAMTESDPHFALLHYDPKEKDYNPDGTIPRLILSEETSRKQLKQFSGRIPELNPRSKPQAFINMRFQHSLPADEIQDVLLSYGPDFGITMWKKSLQVPSSVEIGWLQFSHRNLPTELLATKLEVLLKVPVSLRWRRQPGSPDGRYSCSALFIEVPLRNSEIIESELKLLYPPHLVSPDANPAAFQASLFPLGINMVFVPQRTRQYSPLSASDVKSLSRCWQLQESFVLHLCSADSTQFTGIDEPVDGWEGGTVRAMLMGLPAPDEAHDQPLIHSINTSFQGSVLVTTAYFFPAWRKKVGHLFTYPVAILRATIPHDPLKTANLDAMFTDHAIEEAAKGVYDEKRGQIVNRGRTGTSYMEETANPFLAVFANPAALAVRLRALGLDDDNSTNPPTPHGNSAPQVTFQEPDPSRKRSTVTASPDRPQASTSQRNKLQPPKKKATLPGQGRNQAGTKS